MRTQVDIDFGQNAAPKIESNHAPPLFDLRGKVAIVTGGNGGNGVARNLW